MDCQPVDVIGGRALRSAGEADAGLRPPARKSKQS